MQHLQQRTCCSFTIYTYTLSHLKNGGIVATTNTAALMRGNRNLIPKINKTLFSFARYFFEMVVVIAAAVVFASTLWLSAHLFTPFICLFGRLGHSLCNMYVCIVLFNINTLWSCTSYLRENWAQWIRPRHGCGYSSRTIINRIFYDLL